MILQIILSLLFSQLISQSLKVILIAKKKRLELNDIIATGGMPSSHAAFVTALSTSLFLLEGPSSAFFVSLGLALVVLRDAVGVRRTVGDLVHIAMKKKEKVYETAGHTLPEAIIGIIIGFFSSLLVALL